jgi:hypothetical protein
MIAMLNEMLQKDALAGLDEQILKFVLDQQGAVYDEPTGIKATPFSRIHEYVSAHRKVPITKGHISLSVNRLIDGGAIEMVSAIHTVDGTLYPISRNKELDSPAFHKKDFPHGNY